MVEMGMCKIVKQMGKVDSRCWYKIATFEKWLFEILN
jgi:hypothetical protein